MDQRCVLISRTQDYVQMLIRYQSNNAQYQTVAICQGLMIRYLTVRSSRVDVCSGAVYLYLAASTTPFGNGGLAVPK